MSEQEEKPSLLRQITAKTSSTGTMLMGQIKSLGGNKTPAGAQQNPTSPNSPLADLEDDDSDLSNVPLSSDEESGKGSPVKSRSSVFSKPKPAIYEDDKDGANGDNSQEGILGKLKETTLSAGDAMVNATKTAGTTVVNTTTQAGAVIVGGLKATTQLLNPLNIGKRKDSDAPEPEVDQKKIEEEFASIEIEDPVEEEQRAPAQKAGFFDQLKLKSGLVGAGNQDAARRPSATSPTPKHLFHHDERVKACEAHHHDDMHSHGHSQTEGDIARGAVKVGGDAQKPSILEQIRTTTGLAPKEKDDIARDNAPKEGFFDHLKVANPFAASSEPPKRQPVPPPKRQPSAKSSGGGITGMFDSLTGKPAETKKAELVKQPSVFDKLTGNTSATPANTKKEGGFMDSLMGGGSSSNTKSSSDGSFW